MECVTGRGLAQGSATVLAMWKTVPACVVATQRWMSAGSAVAMGFLRARAVATVGVSIAEVFAFMSLGFKL